MLWPHSHHRYLISRGNNHYLFFHHYFGVGAILNTGNQWVLIFNTGLIVSGAADDLKRILAYADWNMEGVMQDAVMVVRAAVAGALLGLIVNAARGSRSIGSFVVSGFLGGLLGGGLAERVPLPAVFILLKKRRIKAGDRGDRMSVVEGMMRAGIDNVR